MTDIFYLGALTADETRVLLDLVEAGAKSSCITAGPKTARMLARVHAVRRESLVGQERRTVDEATLPLSIRWCPEARDWYCPDLGLHGSQLPPATRALLPQPPIGAKIARLESDDAA